MRARLHASICLPGYVPSVGLVNCHIISDLCGGVLTRVADAYGNEKNKLSIDGMSQVSATECLEVAGQRKGSAHRLIKGMLRLYDRPR
jgi:hypothetical protein